MTLISAMNPGLSGILASQKNVEVTGNNIANVNTPGYSRQTAPQSPAATVNIRGLNIGQGVEIKEVRREYDRFVAGQLRDQNSLLGEESAKSGPLAELERVFGIGKEALAGEIEGFFGAWHDLAENPSGSVERERVLYEGENLLDSFAHTETELARITQNINHSLKAEVNDINHRLREVARLNRSIKQKEALGYAAHTDRDARDLAVKELSGMMGVQQFDSGEGQVGLQLPGGISLVQGANAATVEYSYDDNGNVIFRVADGDVTRYTARGNFGGEIGGMLDVRDHFIPDIRGEVRSLRDTIVVDVNAVHEEGYDLDGETGTGFFHVGRDADDNITGVEVGIASTREIAAAGQEGGAPGDNENAIAMHALMTKRGEDTNETYPEHYSRIAAMVGTETRRNNMARDGAADTMNQLENQRESIVGVSIEQEMINLIMFQKGFEASSRYISTIDEMLGTIIGMKR